MTPANQHSRGHRNIIATSARHRKQDRDITVTLRDITQATQNQDRHITETRPRHGRDMSESMNFSSLKHHPSTYGPQLRAKVHNLQIQIGIEVLLRNPIKMFINAHHQKNKTHTKHHHQSKKKKHCNINDTTPSHHPLIIKTSQHHHHTSRRLHRICPRRHQHITERSPKHHQKTNKTTPKQPRDITKKNRDRDMTETSPKQHRDKTETRPRKDRDAAKT